MEKSINEMSLDELFESFKNIVNDIVMTEDEVENTEQAVDAFVTSSKTFHNLEVFLLAIKQKLIEQFNETLLEIENKSKEKYSEEEDFSGFTD